MDGDEAPIRTWAEGRIGHRPDSVLRVHLGKNMLSDASAAETWDVVDVRGARLRKGAKARDNKKRIPEIRSGIRQYPSVSAAVKALALEDQSREQVLLEMIPGLAYELGSAGKVADQIRREGLEQPHDSGKVLALGSDHLMPFVDEQLLAEFELREDLRRKLEQLRIWVEKANFSELEARVLDLDMRTGYDTKTIARALDLKGDTVRVLRKRYTDKLCKAAGS